MKVTHFFLVLLHWLRLHGLFLFDCEFCFLIDGLFVPGILYCRPFLVFCPILVFSACSVVGIAIILLMIEREMYCNVYVCVFFVYV